MSLVEWRLRRLWGSLWGDGLGGGVCMKAGIVVSWRGKFSRRGRFLCWSRRRDAVLSSFFNEEPSFSTPDLVIPGGSDRLPGNRLHGKPSAVRDGFGIATSEIDSSMSGIRN